MLRHRSWHYGNCRYTSGCFLGASIVMSLRGSETCARPNETPSGLTRAGLGARAETAAFASSLISLSDAASHAAGSIVGVDLAGVSQPRRATHKGVNSVTTRRQCVRSGNMVAWNARKRKFASCSKPYPRESPSKTSTTTFTSKRRSGVGLRQLNAASSSIKRKLRGACRSGLANKVVRTGLGWASTASGIYRT